MTVPNFVVAPAEIQVKILMAAVDPYTPAADAEYGLLESPDNFEAHLDRGLANVRLVKNAMFAGRGLVGAANVWTMWHAVWASLPHMGRVQPRQGTEGSQRTRKPSGRPSTSRNMCVTTWTCTRDSMVKYRMRAMCFSQHKPIGQCGQSLARQTYECGSAHGRGLSADFYASAAPRARKK